MKVRHLRHRRFTRSTEAVKWRACFRAFEASVDRFCGVVGKPIPLPPAADTFIVRRYLPFLRQENPWA